MKHHSISKRLHGAVVILAGIIASLLFVQNVQAFALLGPYADWMLETNGHRLAGDIGGPMNLGEEYRWNVPMITYAFDDSFVSYFGSNGVAAVESAIQVLNSLPAASDIALSNYPTDTLLLNERASSQNVYDLKSATLALLIEQLGLTQPSRNVLDLHGWNPAMMQSTICGESNCPNMEAFPGLVIQRNFDPATLNASFAVNGTVYAGFFQTNASPLFNDIVEFPVDPLAPVYTAVADAYSFWYYGLYAGDFYTGLTRDDVGGLRYLLSATNVNWESLPQDVIFTGSRALANKRLRGAWRPGVEKITFVRQPQKKNGKFKTKVFEFTAFYVTNGVVRSQSAKRIVSHPDILFSMADTYQTDPTSWLFLRTDTTQWTNNAGQNGNPGGAGPGVINSPIQIIFGKLGPQVISGEDFNPASVINNGWSSFNGSTNPPVVYPQNTGQTNLLVLLHFYAADAVPSTEISNTLFDVPVPYGGVAAFQISTNQIDWTSLITVTNTGSVVSWDYWGSQVPISFRVVPASF